MSKNIVFLLNQSEIAAGTRGALLGPDAILTAARRQGLSIFGDNEVQRLRNWNELLDKPTPFAYAKRIDGLLNTYEELNDVVAAILKRDRFPFIIAADHGSAGGTIAGIKAAYPNKRLGVVWIDAHADIHTPYTTPTGNMHGMPLATALGVDNLECQVNEIDADTQSMWERLKNVGGITPKIKPEDVLYIAVRDTEPQEDCLLDVSNIRNIKVAEVREKGVAEIVKIIDEKLSHCDLIYVSFDVDSMDPDLTSYGTGTPVKDGLTPEEATEILERLALHPKLICMEMVELNPCLDEKTNTMAEIVLRIVNLILQTLKK